MNSSGLWHEAKFSIGRCFLVILGGVEYHQQRIRRNLPFTPPTGSVFLYVFFILKKTFTLSHEGFFFLILYCFECEGFDFQAFTAKGRVFCRFLYGFQRFSSVKACFSHPSQAIGSTISGNGQLSQETVNRKQKFSDITVNQNQEKSSIHSCECFVFQTFTSQIIENQEETSFV